MALKFAARWRALCLAACVVALPTAWAGQVKYSSLYAFGDSLSDTGNSSLTSSNYGFPTAVPPSKEPHAAYWKGRFSNGPVAVEHLWRIMTGKHNSEVAPSVNDPALQNKSAISFAYGGSSSNSGQSMPLGYPVENLQSQVQQFKGLVRNKPPKHALYVVWSGANDYLQGLSVEPDKVTDNVLKAVTDLYESGARDFLVPNLANLGRTPFVLGPDGKGDGAPATQLTNAHNAMLKAKLASLRSLRSDIRIVEVDVYKLGETIVSTGLVWTNIPAMDYLVPPVATTPGMPPALPTSLCLFVPPIPTNACPNVPQNGILPPFMFWDAMHPTTMVHGVLGAAMFGALLTQR